MRNPIRFKNLRPRFLPYYAFGALVLIFSRPSPASFAMGGLLVVAGEALRSWGAGHLVKTDRLVTSGPYARLRHPLYAGTLLVALGFSVIVAGWIGVLVAVLLTAWFLLDYFPRKEQSESARLAERHGDAFASYREQVPALWPRRSRWRPAPSAGPAERSSSDPGWSLERFGDNNELGTLLAVAAGLGVLALRTVGLQ